MSNQITQEVFLEKFYKIYPQQNITILEWHGFTKKITFYCDKCGEIHTINDARQLLNKKTYCQKQAKNNIKWDLNSYNERINLIHDAIIEIIEYNGLSNIVKYKCPRCGQIKSCAPARTLITKLSLCDACYGIEKNIVEKQIRQKFKESKDYELLTWRGSQKKLTQKCLRCGFIYDRYPTNVLQRFDTCPNCNGTKQKQILTNQEIQSRIDHYFGINCYELLFYDGQLSRHNKIRCLNCGLIFETHMVSFLTASRGCPKCKRFKSKGEQKVQKYLESNNIMFESQKRFKDCNNNLSSFDFCVYDNNNQMYLVEINGEQHYKENKHFGDFSIIQRRDTIKKNYCLEHNIPLIVIPYTKLTDKDIDEYLSFLKGSTTIP